VTGKIISVNISKDKGEKKHNIEKCLLIKDMGLKDDAHAGFMHRQVSLLARESIDKIKNMGLDVVPGDFAENLTTEGIDLPSLPIGTKLMVGNGIVLRVTQIGKECHARCAIFQQVGDCVMPREGIFAEVLTEGEVKVGDTIMVEQ
jgi:MOSC domain-containing protein YiiM